MATAKKTEAKTVKALMPVQYDHVSVAVGETFEVRASDLPQLLEVNAVELVEEKPAAA